VNFFLEKFLMKGVIKMNDNNKKAIIIRSVILVLAVLVLIALWAWRFGFI